MISAMLTDASAATPGIREVVVDSLDRPTRASMSHALRSFIIDRTDVTDRLADIDVPSLFVASDDRGTGAPRMRNVRRRLSPRRHSDHDRGSAHTRSARAARAVAQAILAFWAADGPEEPRLSDTPA